MAVAVSDQGGLLVRVDPDSTDRLLASTKVTPMIMRGRNMPGWLRVAAEEGTSDDELARWVELGTSYAQTLPPR